MDRRVMVVEDEEFIRDILVYSLQKEGFKVLQSSSGEEALKKLRDIEVDCILLDIMLPDMDGFALYEGIRSFSDTPIIFLTARSDISDKLEGLKLGAEDYITKPFDIREVIARIEVVLRRGWRLKKESGHIIDVGNDITINKRSHQVKIKGHIISFKPKEYQLLLLLAENRNVAFSREQLLEKIWGFTYEGDSRTVDVHIQRVRKKLNDTKDNKLIQTVFGVGYRMN